jgi:predicted RNA-binding Zn-ribbon protein involved in translation (DUF1610 family)
MPINAADHESRGRKRTIGLSIVLVVLLAGLGYSVLRNRQPAIKPKLRTAFDIAVTWRCLACGHTLTDNAAVGPRACPQCGKAELYVSIRHQCRNHGVFPVAFQYDENGRPTEVKVARGPWVPHTLEHVESEDDPTYNVRCPKCGDVMDPLP